MPKSSTLIKGTLKDVYSKTLSGETVTLTHTSGTLTKTTDANGDYIFNLGDLSSWAEGDSITVTSTVTGKGTKSETVAISTGGNTVNLTLAETSNLEYIETEQNQYNIVFTVPTLFDGTKVNVDYPIPVDANLKKHTDSTTNAVTTIEYEHHEVHSGSHYFYADSVTLAAAGTQTYMVTTPNSERWCHTVFIMIAGLGATFVLAEGGDRVGSVLQATPNSNRNSGNTPGCIVHKGTGGGTTDGTTIAKFAAGSTSVGGKIGGGARAEEEIILRANTKYLMTITSAANANNVTLFITWYEHTDK